MIDDLKICKKCNKSFTHKRNDTRGMYCSRTCGFSHPTIKSVNDFSEDSADVYYFAGFIFGDGSIKNNTVKIGLAKNAFNLALLEKMSQYLFGYNNVKNYKNIYNLMCTSDTLSKSLSRFGIVQNKTYIGELIIPNKNYESDFVRGYFDADGWIGNNKYIQKYRVKDGTIRDCHYVRSDFGMCSYKSTNMEKVASILPIQTRIIKKKTQELYELRSSNKPDLRILRRWLYRNNCVCLENKREKFWNV
jgi:hypothetical protein